MGLHPGGSPFSSHLGGFVGAGVGLRVGLGVVWSVGLGVRVGVGPGLFVRGGRVGRGVMIGPGSNVGGKVNAVVDDGKGNGVNGSNVGDTNGPGVIGTGDGVGTGVGVTCSKISRRDLSGVRFTAMF